MIQDTCFFCKFASGAAKPGQVVHESPDALAFLDIHPHAPGHTVIIPRAHRTQLADLGAPELTGLFSAVRTVTTILAKALDTQAFTIGINQGAEAGNAIEHLHVHVMPRFTGDGGGSLHTVVNNPPKEPLEKIVEKIKSVH